VSVPDEKWGRCQRRSSCLRPGQTASVDELVAYCKANLAGFKVPKSIELRDSLPKGGTGKDSKGEFATAFLGRYEKACELKGPRAGAIPALLFSRGIVLYLP